MTTLFKWLNNRYLIGWFLAFSLAIGLVMVGWKCDLSKSDWATWVGSIGTVGTLIGTIWLATAQARLKRSEQLTMALVSAAHLMVRVRNVIGSLAQTRDKLSTPLTQPNQVITAFVHCRQTFHDRDMWTMEEIVPLVHLPNQTAAKLAWVAVKIQSIKGKLEKVSEGEQSDWEAVGLFTRGLIYEINSVLAQANQAHADCTLFLAKHGFESAMPRYESRFDSANTRD